MTSEDLLTLSEYQKKFDQYPPEPIGVPDDIWINVLKEHIKKGEPVPNDFDWYKDVPNNSPV